MGNDDTGAALHQFLEGILNQFFGFGVNIGGGFVEYQQNIGVLHQRPRKGDELFLTRRKTCTPLAHGRVVALG